MEKGRVRVGGERKRKRERGERKRKNMETNE
jgi:hypothetical protein